MQDLRKHNAQFVTQVRPPLIERDPVRVWQGIAVLLAAVIMSFSIKS